MECGGMMEHAGVHFPLIVRQRAECNDGLAVEWTLECGSLFVWLVGRLVFVPLETIHNWKKVYSPHWVMNQYEGHEDEGRGRGCAH